MSDIVERLRNSVLRDVDDNDSISGLPDIAADEIERLRADNERLREALEKIADDGNATGCNPQIMCNTARAALGEEKK
jgi:hypothetical protein